MRAVLRRAAVVACIAAVAACTNHTPPKLTPAPVDGASGVAPGLSLLTLVSDVKLDAKSVTTANVTLTGATKVDVTVALSADGRTIDVTPPAGGLAEHARYTLAAKNVRVDPSVGDGVLAKFESTFTTGGLGPRIVSVSPPDGTTDVEAGALQVVVTFDSPMEPTTTVAAISLSPALDGTTTLSDDGKTATFTPTDAAAIPEKTTYTVTVAATATDADDHLPLESASTTTFTTGDAPPRLVTTTPANGATDVSTTDAIALSFSEPVALTDASSVELLDGATEVPATATVDDAGTTVTLTPQDRLLENTAYTVEIGDSLVDADDGLPLDGAPVAALTFTTETVPLTVVTTSPEDGATGVHGEPSVTITFSNPVASDSVTDANVTLADGGGATVQLALSLDAANEVLTLTPTAPLNPDTDYVLTLGTGVVDYSRLPLAEATLVHFHTATGPTVTGVTPLAGAVGEPLTSQVQVTFSGPVAGVTPATLTVSADGKLVAGQISVGATSATFVPSSPLDEATTYTVSLSQDVTSPNGDRLTPFTSTFTTVGGVPKLVSARLEPGDVPMDLTGRAPTPGANLSNVHIVLTFDHTLDGATEIFTVTDPSGNAVASDSNGTNSGTSSDGSAVVSVNVASLPTELTTFAMNVPATLKSEAGVAIAAPISLRFTTEAKPRLYTTPHDLAQGVPTNSALDVVFNKPMSTPRVTTDAATPLDLTLYAAPLAGGQSPTLQKARVTMDATNTVAKVELLNDVGTVVPLAASSRYTLVVSGALADQHGNTLGADVAHVFDTGDGADANATAFQVSQIVPADGATDVPAASLDCATGKSGVRVVFSGPIDPTTATSANVQLSQGVTVVPTRVVVPSRFPSTANEIDLCPTAPLLPATSYSVQVGAGVKSLTGFAVLGAAEVSFATAADVAPAPARLVVSDTATNQGTSREGTVAPNSRLQLRFGDVTIDPSTLDVVLTDIAASGTSSTVAASTAYDATTNSAVITPASALVAGDTINVTVRAGLESVGGTATVSDLKAGTLQVAASNDTSSPLAILAAPTTTNAADDSPVTVTFSKNIDPRTLEAPGALQVVDANGAAVSGTLVAVNTTQATFQPSPGVFFKGNATYKVRLSPNVADLAGNKLSTSTATLTFLTHAEEPREIANDIAAGQLASLSPLTLDFDGELDPASEQKSVTITDTTANESIPGAVSEAARPSAGAATTLVVVPSAPWRAGHQYDVTVGTTLVDVGGLALAGALDESFAVSTGPSVTASIFAAANAGQPTGGFDPGCANFSADNAVLDLAELPGQGSGDSCQSNLALANMPLWIRFSGPLDPASANDAANFTLTTNGSAVAVTPRYDAAGDFVEIDPPNGSWLPALPAATYPVGASYTLTVAGVKDASGTAMSASRTLSFRTVVVSMFEDSSTAAEEPTYATSTTPAGLLAQDVWGWHAGDVKNLAFSPSWVTDPTEADYARDCQPLPRSGQTVTMSMRTPDHGFGSFAPRTDVLLRVRQLYGVDAAAGDFLTISVSANGGGQLYPLVGGGGFYSFASAGRSPDYATKSETTDEYSLVQKAGLFGGPAGLAALPGVRAQFDLTAQGFQTTLTRSCPATDLGWAVGAYAIVAY